MSIPFHFDFPVDVFEKSDDGQELERRIGGIISTEHKDFQDEVVVQKGLDFSYFQKNGWLNDNHSKETTGIVGYPLAVKSTTVDGKPATYMEGYLIPNYKPSDKIWELAQALKKTNRKLGFSVEGHVKRREGDNGKIVAKAFVTNVAITNCPFNDKTNLEVLAKSLRYVEAQPLSALEKAMLVGANPTPGATSATPGDAGPIMKESLETGAKNTTMGVRKKKKKKNKTDKEIFSKAHAINMIMCRFPTLDLKKAFRLYDLICKVASRRNQDGYRIH